MSTGFRDDVVLSSFWKVETLGKKADPEDTEPVPPGPDTPGIIMYTSGSTGESEQLIHCVNYGEERSK